MNRWQFTQVGATEVIPTTDQQWSWQYTQSRIALLDQEVATNRKLLAIGAILSGAGALLFMVGGLTLARR